MKVFVYIQIIGLEEYVFIHMTGLSVCAHIYYRLESVHIYLEGLSVCAHIYDRLECVHIYTTSLHMCTYIWKVWVCIHIHVTGLSVCTDTHGRLKYVCTYIWKVCMCAHIYSRFVHVCTCVKAPVTPSKDHVPCYMERLLTVPVWFGLKMCTVAVLHRGKKPWAPQTWAKSGSVLHQGWERHWKLHHSLCKQG